jgi:hypothetical protein
MSFMAPVVEASLTLLSELSHTRTGLSTGPYRPHIVVGPQSQRVAILDRNRLTENYLGVIFVGGPEAMKPGDTADVKIALMYFPEQQPKANSLELAPKVIHNKRLPRWRL